MRDRYDGDRISEDHLATAGAYTPCPTCGETVGVTTDGPCIACVDDFDAEDVA